VEQKQDAGDSVREALGLALAGQECTDPLTALVLGQHGLGSGCSVTDGDPAFDVGGVCPDEERPDQISGFWAVGEVLVDVELAALRQVVTAALVKPGQKLEGLGDFLLGGMDRPPGPGGADVAHLADSCDVVPARELLEGLTYLSIVDSCELVGEPPFEER